MKLIDRTRGRLKQAIERGRNWRPPTSDARGDEAEVGHEELESARARVATAVADAEAAFHGWTRRREELVDSGDRTR